MNSSPKLTIKQAEVLNFLKEFHRRMGTTPTYREISSRFGFKSPKAATDHVRALEKKHYVRVHRGRARGIELLSTEGIYTDGVISVPLVGMVPAGRPVDQVQYTTRVLAVDKAILGASVGHSLFALQVNGDSMRGRGIHDGDWVVAGRDIEPREGNIVVALIDNENTLKTLASQNRRYFLKAENENEPDWIPIQEMMIQGVVKLVLRRIE